MIGEAIRNFRLIVVEDEALIAMLIQDALALSGHDVLGTADTIADALAMVEQDRPDLVLCDIKLLNGNGGCDVAAALAKRHIPCLLLSGNCPDSEYGRGMAIGRMLKPFRPARLEDAIQAAMALNVGPRPDRLPIGVKVY